MPSRRTMPALSLSLVLLLILTACAAGGNETNQDATIDRTTRTAETSVAQASPMNENGTASSSSDDIIAQERSTDEVTPTSQSTESSIIAATAVSDEPIIREAPTGPAPTEVPISMESDFDTDGDGFYTFDDLERAVNHLFPSYEWPENYQVTPEHMLSGFAPMAEQGARWQVQYEYTLVGLYHVCAWEHAWLDAFREGNTESMDESVYQLLNVAVANPVFIHLRDGIEERTNRALLGDPALIQRHVDNSCASYEFLPPN